MHRSLTRLAAGLLLVCLALSAGQRLSPRGAAPGNSEALSRAGGMPAVCAILAFSTEEDFITRGPVPPDGNPYISDGDLLGLGCTICARNYELIRQFDIGQGIDLGLDAVDIINIDASLVAFSTELDSPNRGQFTSGDLLATNGLIIPNVALLYKFQVSYDLGLDGLQFVGEPARIMSFMAEAVKQRRDYYIQNPSAVADLLVRYNVDIWFSTEGSVAGRILDGDLLSARTGTIVVAQSALLPPAVPAGLPNRGVDFGLDAVACDRRGNLQTLLFSTEILFGGEPGFTDGDALRLGAGVEKTNADLIGCFEPKAKFVGLDALSFADTTQPTCGAAIIRVGGMPAGSIGSNGLANGPSATAAVFTALDSPFGGIVELIGLKPLSCAECVKFRYEIGAWTNNGLTPPASWTPLTDPFDEWTFYWPWFYLSVRRVPDAQGWLPILCDTVMGGLYYPWNTAGKNGKYSVRLTVQDSGGVNRVSIPVIVKLDNLAPDASLTLDTVPICGDIRVGDKVTGKISAIDPHFYSYRLRYESSLASGNILPVRKYTSVTDTGDSNLSFTWDTAGLPACGYQIILEVWDRTIVSGGRSWGEPGYGFRTPKSAYFCLEVAVR